MSHIIVYSQMPLYCSAGGTQRLPRLVGRSKAKELIFTGRKINSSDAMSMGTTNLTLLCIPHSFILYDHTLEVHCVAGLVNFCVSAGGAHLKALEIARDINQKVS